ncbi:MAG: PAS domain-containing protein [Pararhodobacter sp.]|nr:PAS domain-containing protein [Pararhodobacter sp.]
MTDAPKPITRQLREQAGKILRLPFALRAPALDYPLADSVLRYWDGLRGTRLAPARAEVDPRNISQALEYTFIAELVTPEIARLRITGRHFEDLLGMDPRGMPLGVFFALDARDELAQALSQVSQGARAQLPLRGESGLGKPGLDGLLILLPLTDAQGQITRVLGVLETHGQIGRHPRRFKLSGARMQHPAQPVPAATGASPAPARPMRPAPPVEKAGARPQLRVITGGRSQGPRQP